MVEKPGKFQPALMGGLVLGLLSAIPFISLGNCLCCMWVLMGGAIASKSLINRSHFPVTTGDGATVGALSGVIGALVYLLIGLPLGLIFSGFQNRLLLWFAGMTDNPEVMDQVMRLIEQSQTQSTAEQVIGMLILMLIGSVLIVAFATLGGIIGVSLFEKRKAQYPVQPPPGPYGGNQPPY